MGHAHISTTRIYDHRNHKPEESPTFRVRYLLREQREEDVSGRTAVEEQGENFSPYEQPIHVSTMTGAALRGLTVSSTF